MVKEVTGFLENPAAERRRRPIAERLHDWHECPPATTTAARR